MTGYCGTHAALNEQHGRDFGPFPGCPDCPRPKGSSLKGQPHLYGPRPDYQIGDPA